MFTMHIWHFWEMFSPDCWTSGIQVVLASCQDLEKGKQGAWFYWGPAALSRFPPTSLLSIAWAQPGTHSFHSWWTGVMGGALSSPSVLSCQAAGNNMGSWLLAINPTFDTGCCLSWPFLKLLLEVCPSFPSGAKDSIFYLGSASSCISPLSAPEQPLSANISVAKEEYRNKTEEQGISLTGSISLITWHSQSSQILFSVCVQTAFLSFSCSLRFWMVLPWSYHRYLSYNGSTLAIVS